METQRNTGHTRQRYDLFAPVYDLMEAPVERLLYRRWRRELWRDVHGPRVLEIGVGTGRNVPFHPKDIKITAIDLSPKMLDRARRIARKHPDAGVTLLEMDAEQLEFPDEHFDDVVATFVFCSVPDPIRGLQEAFRVARPGGKLHLLEHMRVDAPALGAMMQRLDPPIHWLTGVHIARETVKNVERAGWTVDEAKSLTPYGMFKRIEAHR